MGGSRAERFLAHRDRVSGGLEPRFTRVSSTKPGLHGVTVMAHEGAPESGMLTAITYGLSLAEHPEWRAGKPELAIAVRSADLAWGHVIGHLAETLRGECPFSYPIHQSERAYIHEHGLEAFWNTDWDPYDVTLRPAV